MITLNITPTVVDKDDINFTHSGDCLDDDDTLSTCESIYVGRLNDNIQLCAALRAVYAIAGEDPQVRRIVEDALNEYEA